MVQSYVSERSPIRVFEGTTRGGLGRGNLGIVTSRPGVGKSAMLVQIAIDSLMRDRRVLHLSLEHAADHVRAYYDELLSGLVDDEGNEGPDAVRLNIERHRLIYSHLRPFPSSLRVDGGGADEVRRIRDTLEFAREVQHFVPDLVVVDGFDFGTASEASVAELAAIARAQDVELWASATTLAATAEGKIVEPVARFASMVAVVVFLEPEREFVHLRLLKDHDSPTLSDLHLRLDPQSMRVISEDVRPPADHPREPGRYRLHSGGAKGAEAAFGACAERWGLSEQNYSFEGHSQLARDRGVVKLEDKDLKLGDFSLVYVKRRLGRALSDIPVIRHVLQSLWHQVNAASQVFVIGAIQDDLTVRGGTGWAVELARLWKKPLFVYDQPKSSWFRWNGKSWETTPAPRIESYDFAGTGTQDLAPSGQEAISRLFYDSFGEPRG